MADPHAVEFAATAARQVQRLPEKVAAACLEFVLGPLAENPRRLDNPLLRGLVGHYSARRGLYRVVYLVDEDTRTVQIIRVDHRADVYRSR